MTARALPSLTEKEWQRQVVHLALLYHWWVYHPQLSKWSEPGWVDLTLIRGERMLLIELKSDRGKLTKRQEYVHGLLRQVRGIEFYLFRPSDFERLQEVLK